MTAITSAIQDQPSPVPESGDNTRTDHTDNANNTETSKVVTESPESSPAIHPAIEISMWRNPGPTLQYFGHAVHGMLPKTWPWRKRTTFSFLLLSISILTLHYIGKRGHMDWGSKAVIQGIFLWLERALLETLFWIGCGILSTAGLGSGLQTGALFLFPHVCRLALTWAKRQESESPPSLGALLWSVAVPGFWSGGGSAVGELVPFVLARVIKQAGGDPFAILQGEIPSEDPKSLNRSTTNSSTVSESEISVSSESSADSSSTQGSPPSTSSTTSSAWTPHLLVSNTKSAMQRQLSTNVFWKIFALAVVPNALFDLAGLVCGATSGISMMEFFAATWAAKALVRTPSQTCGLALAVVTLVRPSSLSWAGKGSELILPSWFQTWGRSALEQFAGDMWMSEDAVTTATEDPSFVATLCFGALKFCWSCLTVSLFFFFIVTTMEQVARHHVRRHGHHGHGHGHAHHGHRTTSPSKKEKTT